MSNTQDFMTAMMRDYDRRLDALEGALQGLVIGQSSLMVEGFFLKTGIADVTATSIFSITTTNETGSTDAGTYSVYVHALITHAVSSNASNTAVKSFVAHFGRASKNDGTGSNTAVSEISESASAATTSATRDIGTVTMTVVETSEYQQDVQFTLDLTGSGVTTAGVHCYVRVVYQSYFTPPRLAQL